MRYEDNVVNCAKRLVAKLHSGRCYKYNGEYLTPVKKEIEKMIQHCAALQKQRSKDGIV